MALCFVYTFAYFVIAGIALSIVAVLVLGFSGGSGSFGSGDGATGGTIAMKVLYFLICWGVWGANDTLSSAGGHYLY